MTRQAPAKRVTRAEGRLFAGRAREFLQAAEESQKLKLWTAATSNAVHAGINAADAITAFAIGKRSSGASHDQALALLKDVDGGKAVTALLAPLIKLKPRAEYDPSPVKPAQAAEAVKKAAKLVALAESADDSRR